MLPLGLSKDGVGSVHDLQCSFCVPFPYCPATIRRPESSEVGRMGNAQPKKNGPLAWTARALLRGRPCDLLYLFVFPDFLGSDGVNVGVNDGNVPTQPGSSKLYFRT